MRKDPPKALGAILPGAIEKAGLARRVKGGVALLRWPEAVGEIAARKSEAYRLARGRLSVRVESSAWLQELKMSAPVILARLNEGLIPPPVREIYFRVDELRLTAPPVPDEGAGTASERRPGPARTAAEPFSPTVEEKNQIDRDLAPVGDPEIREVLRRARLAHAAAVKRRGDRTGPA